MRRNNIVPIKFSTEELKLIERAIEHHNKFLRLSETNRSKLIREGSLVLAKKILASKKIVVTFEK